VGPITRKNGEPYLTGTVWAVATIWAKHEAGAEDWEIARDLGLTTDHVEYALKFQRRQLARREKKRDTLLRSKAVRGRTQKRRGYQCEKRLEAQLTEFGFTRVVMSGALGGQLSGDLRRPNDDRRALHIVECKQRQNGHATLRRWLAQGGAELLLVDPGAGGEPLAVMELKTLRALLGEAGYGAAVSERKAST
jgi:uncharacterized protein (DUF433 family)